MYEKAKLYQLKKLNIETMEHVYSVSKLSIFIGRKLNLQDDRLYTLGEMSFFHDIGKSMISSNIIEKDGPLNDDEFKEIMKHPEYGRNILIDYGFTEKEAEMVYHHHERCDGSGYPLGLKGHEISLESKIIAACDVFDALLSDRSYKRPWIKDNVKKFFIKNKKKFDDSIVDIIINDFEKMMEIRDYTNYKL